jgi:hypothetical protein
MRVNETTLESHREALPWIIALACCSAVVLTYYPGFMTSDSVSQLWQARHTAYADWYPPTIAFVWRGLDRLVPGPICMMLLQNLLFWPGLVLSMRARYRPAAAATAVAAVGTFPPVFSWLGTVMSDVLMGAALTLAVGLLLDARRRRSRASLAGAVLAMAIATAFRHNAIAAVLPLAFLATATAADLTGCRLSVGGVTATGVALAVALFAASVGVNTKLTRIHQFPSQAVMLHDVTGLSLATGENLLPPYVQAHPVGASLSELAARYDPDFVDPLIWNDKPLPPLAHNKAQYAEMRTAWLAAIRRHPGEYAARRASLAASLLGLGARESYMPFFWGIHPNDMLPPYRETLLTPAVMRIMNGLRATILFRGWAYLIILVAVVLIAARRRDHVLGLIAASAILYIVPLFAIMPGPVFRYLWWPVVAALILVAHALSPAFARLTTPALARTP